MAVAHEELLRQFLLQMQNLLRERALGDKKFACCLREIERLGHAEEVFQLSYFHCTFCFWLQNYYKSSKCQHALLSFLPIAAFVI